MWARLAFNCTSALLTGKFEISTMYFLFLILSLLTEALYTVSQSQTNCQYKLTGDALKNDARGTTEIDGSKWKMVLKNGKEMLELKFNGSVVVYQISIQLRLRHTRIVRITSHDVDGNSVHNLYNVVVGRSTVLVSQPMQRPIVGKLTLQGFFMPIEEDEIDTINVTACPTDCPVPPPCYGNCKLTANSGCMNCLCPKDSLSKGCSGFNGNRELRLLWELTKRETKGCQFVQGYRRHQDKITGLDECVSFNYARCDWYLLIVVPRTRAECLQHCF